MAFEACGGAGCREFGGFDRAIGRASWRCLAVQCGSIARFRIFGRALGAAARQAAQEAGAAVLTVGAQPGNPRAQGFYKGLGFRVARQGSVQFFLPLDLSAAGLAG